MNLSALATLTRKYIEQEHPHLVVSTPLPAPVQELIPILIVHGEERQEELAMLERMAQALCEKVALTKLIKKGPTLPPSTLLVMTQQAKKNAPPDALVLPPLHYFVEKPHTRKLLWQQLLERYRSA